MRRTLISSGALVAAATASLVLAPAAFASEGPKPLPLHQVEDLPLTAGEFEKGDCPTVPAGKDGWHFVLPGSGKGDSAVFTKLTVEFEPGGEQTITVFGPPSDKHAYAVSEPGAKLVAASAEVDGTVKQGWFNLSHTCPATPVTETTRPVPEETTPGTETTTPGTETTTPGTETTTPGTETTTPGTETSTPGTETTAPGETPAPSETPGGTESPSATAPAGETAGTGGTDGTDTKGEGDLAETGSSAPVGVLAAVAVALAGAGAFLVSRRRKAQQH
ncbi:LPXTG cell wall anchor domain-containing protein [Streptomyces sp. NPDC058659]|uniref:LPXTG cell wall anchor domain-containing protein n=1 Tax=unclassified Streptomyces TaxID=2593676 RepID=UPI003655D3C6